ncbi:MAG: HDOD domain-containing protein [Thermodesulfobacteriota bacterium]|nr:HDOD domain-containing protein [Thermodesulfobacteriota bacterium]
MTKLALMPHTLTVSPGEYLVTSDLSATLETYLGSCVGVALYDDRAGVGGLLHILLPEAGDEQARAAPAKYARSGIPLLIQEMEAASGKKDRFKGWIAGGAEMLPNRPNIANLDIGPRNVRAACQIMEAQGIPILGQEVGGNLGRRLCLRMDRGVAEFASSANMRRHVKKEATAPSRPDKRDLIKSIKGLPSFSHMATRLFGRIEDETVAFAELKEEIYKDQSLTANILKLCNSAYFGLPHQVTTLSHALILLGMNNLKKIILTALIKPVYSQNANIYFLKKGDLFRHALGCALTMEMLARLKGYVNPEEAFVAGLLHDVGKVILGECALEQFERIMRKIIEEGKDAARAEEEVFGYNHARVGAWVAEAWRLPPLLKDVILCHHQPSEATVDPMMVSLVHVADAICNMLGLGCGTGLANQIAPGAMSFIHLQVKEVEDTISALPEIIKKVEDMF